MTDGKGCTNASFLFNDGEVLEQIKYGEDGSEIHERCPDCGCEKGYLHHLGCSLELCPKCKKSVTVCQCDK